MLLVIRYWLFGEEIDIINTRNNAKKNAKQHEKAAVAELADAQGLGPCVLLADMRVQIPPAAHGKGIDNVYVCPILSLTTLN